jgi:hypothetical protein
MQHQHYSVLGSEAYTVFPDFFIMTFMDKFFGVIYSQKIVFCLHLETNIVSDQRHWRQKTISETIFVEYVEFLRRKQKTTSEETNIVSNDQRQKRQLLSLIRDKRNIIGDKKNYF